MQGCRGPCSKKKNSPEYKGFREEPRLAVKKINVLILVSFVDPVNFKRKDVLKIKM